MMQEIYCSFRAWRYWKRIVFHAVKAYSCAFWISLPKQFYLFFIVYQIYFPPNFIFLLFLTSTFCIPSFRHKKKPFLILLFLLWISNKNGFIFSTYTKKADLSFSFSNLLPFSFYFLLCRFKSLKLLKIAQKHLWFFISFFRPQNTKKARRYGLYGTVIYFVSAWCKALTK